MIPWKSLFIDIKLRNFVIMNYSYVMISKNEFVLSIFNENISSLLRSSYSYLGIYIVMKGCEGMVVKIQDMYLVNG